MFNLTFIEAAEEEGGDINVRHQPNQTTPPQSMKQQTGVKISSSHRDVSTWRNGVWPHRFPPTRWPSHRSPSSPEKLKSECQVVSVIKVAVWLALRVEGGIHW